MVASGRASVPAGRDFYDDTAVGALGMHDAGKRDY